MIETILTAIGALVALIGPIAIWVHLSLKRSKELAKMIEEAEEARRSKSEASNVTARYKGRSYSGYSKPFSSGKMGRFHNPGHQGYVLYPRDR